MQHWRRYRYKHLTGMVCSVILAYFLSLSQVFQAMILSLGEWSIVGAFVGGILFVSSLTVGIGAILLIRLTDVLSPFEIAMIASYGAIVADLVFFRFVKDHLMKELEPLYHKFHGPNLHGKLKSRYLRWSLPILGTIIIASPLPDELGVGLLGLSGLRSYQLLLVTFVLNVIGIYAVLVLI